MSEYIPNLKSVIKFLILLAAWNFLKRYLPESIRGFIENPTGQ